MKFLIYAFLAMGHGMAAFAFVLDGDYTAASVQLGGAAIWGLIALVFEEEY